MSWTTRILLLAAAGLCFGTCAPAQTAAAPAAQTPPQRQIVLTIMTPQVNNFAPGVDATVSLTQEQANQVAAAYRETFESAGAVLANMVLQDSSSSAEQRRVASITLQQAQAAFQARARAAFTDPQRELIDKVQAAFTKVLEALQADFNARVKANFAAELDQILTPAQKQAMMKARKVIEENQAKAAQQPAGGATPAPAPAP